MVPDLEIKNLNVSFETASGRIPVVRELSATFPAGKITGVIGESGSGKSVMGMSILRLLPNTARVTGECWLGDQELYSLPLRKLRRIRGARIGLIPQNPTASLDPVMPLRRQITEAITAHGRHSRAAAQAQAVRLLERFGFDAPEEILRQYPFQMSGGMNQRLVSALGLASQPGWVIADEPTKGLDAVLRGQVYRVLRQIYREQHSSMLLITHDLQLAQTLCDELLVLYMGRIVESGPAQAVMNAPQHPYTAGLLRALPDRGMEPIPAPRADRLHHSGCPFYPRCTVATARCGETMPPWVTGPGGGKVRCHRYG